MILYGAWRFTIEFFRADDRGSTIVSFLTPSQLIAVLMILGSIGLFFGECYIEKKLNAVNDTKTEDAIEEINNED